MNRGHIFLTLIPAGLLVSLMALALLCVCTTEQVPPLPERTSLYLTDLALFPEAPHTRNPILSDMQSAFREGPGASEHTISSLFLASPYTKEYFQ